MAGVRTLRERERYGEVRKMWSPGVSLRDPITSPRPNVGLINNTPSRIYLLEKMISVFVKNIPKTLMTC